MPPDPFTAAASLPGVPAAFAAARDGLDALLGGRALRRREPEVTAESLLHGAWASAVLEGSSGDLVLVRGGGGDRVAQAAVRLSTQLLGVLPVWQRSPVQALARMHTIAAASAVPADRLGRPVDASAARRLHALAAALPDTDAPGMVVSALVHAEVAAAAAFLPYNGLVARAAERLVLVATGVDPVSVAVPELGHLRLAPGYHAGLGAYREGGAPGLRAWLLHAAAAYAIGIEAAAELV